MNIIIYTLVVTHITIIAVTLFLHRGQAHKGIQFHPILSHFFRFWLWLTTGMVTKQWVAIHRKHHAFSDQEGDPHSPHVFGIWTVFTKGAVLYSRGAKDTDMVNKFGVGTPDDWIESNIYTPHSRLGILLMLVIDLVLFGPWGFYSVGCTNVVDSILGSRCHKWFGSLVGISQWRNQGAIQEFNSMGHCYRRRRTT